MTGANGSEERVVGEEIAHPALAGGPWPVIGVRVRREGRTLRAGSWRPAPHAVLEDVLLPCTWPELEGLAQISTGLSRARVFVRDLGGAGPDRRLVLCLRGAPWAVRVGQPTECAELRAHESAGESVPRWTKISSRPAGQRLVTPRWG